MGAPVAPTGFLLSSAVVFVVSCRLEETTARRGYTYKRFSEAG